ncbi:MAG: hypothetical protein ACRDPA_22715, partial [Solirubrobacteraceae bacterium]
MASTGCLSAAGGQSVSGGYPHRAGSARARHRFGDQEGAAGGDLLAARPQAASLRAGPEGGNEYL